MVDVRSGKQDGLHRTFWRFVRRRLVADADTGWSSAALTDATGCMLQSQAMPAVCSCEAARGVAARARDRALFAALSMRNTNEGLTDPARSSRLSQLKQVLAASKTLASSRTREGPLWASMRISRSPPQAL